MTLPGRFRRTCLFNSRLRRNYRTAHSTCLSRSAGGLRIRGLAREDIKQGHLSRRLLLFLFLLRLYGQRFKALSGKRLSVNIGRDISAFRALQGFHNILDGIFIEVRQIEMDIIQDIVHLNMHLHRRPDHSAKELGDIGRVIRMLERHHRLCPRTIPTCGQIFFEEHDTDISVICYTGRLLIANFKSVYGKRGRCASEGMYHLTVFQLETCPLLDL